MELCDGLEARNGPFKKLRARILEGRSVASVDESATSYLTLAVYYVRTSPTRWAIVSSTQEVLVDFSDPKNIFRAGLGRNALVFPYIARLRDDEVGS